LPISIAVEAGNIEIVDLLNDLIPGVFIKDLYQVWPYLIKCCGTETLLETVVSKGKSHVVRRILELASTEELELEIQRVKYYTNYRAKIATTILALVSAETEGRQQK
jgi:hypothetical protein